MNANTSSRIFAALAAVCVTFALLEGLLAEAGNSKAQAGAGLMVKAAVVQPV